MLNIQDNFFEENNIVSKLLQWLLNFLIEPFDFIFEFSLNFTD